MFHILSGCAKSLYSSLTSRRPWVCAKQAVVWGGDGSAPVGRHDHLAVVKFAACLSSLPPLCAHGRQQCTCTTPTCPRWCMYANAWNACCSLTIAHTDLLQLRCRPVNTNTRVRPFHGRQQHMHHTNLPLHAPAAAPLPACLAPQLPPAAAGALHWPCAPAMTKQHMKMNT